MGHSNSHMYAYCFCALYNMYLYIHFVHLLKKWMPPSLKAYCTRNWFRLKLMRTKNSYGENSFRTLCKMFLSNVILNVFVVCGSDGKHRWMTMSNWVEFSKPIFSTPFPQQNNISVNEICMDVCIYNIIHNPYYVGTCQQCICIYASHINAYPNTINRMV